MNSEDVASRSAAEGTFSDERGVPESLSRLISIANGGTYTPPEYTVTRRSWWRRPRSFKTLVKEAAWEFKLNEQLDAIQELGEIGSETALAFLQKIATPSINETYHDGNRYDPYKYYDTYTHHYYYPNAKGELADALRYFIDVDYNTRTVSGYNDQAHAILEQAIERLSGRR